MFPCLKTPVLYDGDLRDEERVLDWLTSKDVFDVNGEIVEVNKKMLEKMLEEYDYIAVFFCMFGLGKLFS